MQLFDLTDAVAVVTGASGWLGPGMVRALRAAGATVVGVARRPDALEAALADTGASWEVADITSDDWPLMLTRIGEQYGRIDVLVNNAHIGRGGSMNTVDADHFDEAWRLSVVSAWQGIQACRPWMERARAAGGAPSVINVSSMYGLVGPDLSLYDAEESRTPPMYGSAKAGLLQLTRYAAAELGPEGIRVNSITPGPFPAEAARQNQEFVHRLASRTMLGRVGEPDELGTSVLFLASRHSGFVTGSNVVVDGGWTVH